MFPLRVDYLARTEGYGMNYTPERVVLLTITIPSIVRLMLSPFWGRLFDSMNFFILRVILNFCFGMAIVTFFATGTLTGIIAGAVFFGIAASGGEVAWSLWVTKFAPADRVADYMSVHTFFTGARGCVAPFLGFYLVEIFRVQQLAWVAFALIAISSLVLLTQRNIRPEERHGEPLTDDITE
jgi:predicted MFS family arabinose efflux permease